MGEVVDVALLRNEQNPEVCDATGDAIKNES